MEVLFALENTILRKKNNMEKTKVEIIAMPEITIRGMDQLLKTMSTVQGILSEIEKRLTEIGGQVEDIGGNARMNMQIHR